ncbi:MAG: cysteine--tRNA ligase [Acidimicrobiales bacterium]|nr:cysteine--tRNA ligase [Acidimicrobiales bacterium]
MGPEAMSPMRLYDTARGDVVPFRPDRMVRLYTCGITPYDATHLGHACTYVTFDILQRRLVDRGHPVRYVRNITDVDDDMLAAARQRGVHHLDLAFGVTRRFDEDMAALGNLAPWAEPRASGAIPAIRRFIHELLDGGWAYRSGGAVFFDVGRSDVFGSLSHLSESEMLVRGAEMGEEPEDSRRHNPLDTILWKSSAVDEPAWDAPWGRGRPGWHVECAAMAVSHLGPTVDLHGGGSDLVHPHHECSAAMASAVTGEPLSRHWMHQAMVRNQGSKMSKSLGNLVFVSDLLAGAEPMAVRLSLLTNHYRTSWDWDPDLLSAAAERLDCWRSASDGDGAHAVGAVRDALDSDLDVPAAVEAVDEAVAEGRGVVQAAQLLGVELADRELNASRRGGGNR